MVEPLKELLGYTWNLLEEGVASMETGREKVLWRLHEW